MTGKTRAMSALIGFGLVTALSGCGRPVGETSAQAATTPRAIPVTVAPLEHRAVERTVDVVGTLRGWEQVTIGAKRIGRVGKVLHDIGDRVKPGAPLVELETIDADLAVEQAERQLEADLAKLGLKEFPKEKFNVAAVPSVVREKVALDRARVALNRERLLLQKNAGSTETYQNAENDEKAAEAALASAVLNAEATFAGAQATRVALLIAQQARTDTEVRAPVLSVLPDGVTEPLMFAVAKRAVAEGQMLKQGDPIIELVVENPLRMWMNVPERYTAEVQTGQLVRISVASHPGTVFEGKVARINPAVEASSRTFQVEATIPNNRGMLRPGGFAKASILTARSAETVVVPLESVVRFAGVTKLFVVEGDKVRSIEVETGQEGTGWIEVTGKLPAQAQVVITGQGQLANDTLVVVRTPEK